MTDSPPAKNRRRKRGRPDRARSSAKALRGIDTSKCDVKETLRSIALDRSLAPSARVAALKVLADLDATEQAAVRTLQAAQDGRDETDEGEDQGDQEGLVRDALALLRPN